MPKPTQAQAAAEAAVFEPLGPVVIALPNADDMQATARALIHDGVAASALLRIGPEEMKAQVDARLRATGPRRALGAALNLLKAHRLLAESGCSFLVVQPMPAPREDPASAAPRRMKSKIGAALWPVRPARAEHPRALTSPRTDTP